MSKIEISVDWGTPIVFAGEEIRCTITFTNTSKPSASPASLSLAQQVRGATSARERWKLDLPNQPSPATSNFPRPTEARSADGKPKRGHRPTLSVNVPVATARASTLGSASTSGGEHSSGPRKHKKSVSIISLGQQTTPTEERERVTPVQHIRNSHARSASFQGLPMQRGSLPFSPQVPQPASPSQSFTPSRSSSIALPSRKSPLSADVERTQASPSSGDLPSRRQSTQLRSLDQILSSGTQDRQGSDTVGHGIQSAQGSQNEQNINGLGLKRNISQRTSRSTVKSVSGEPIKNQSLRRVASPSGTEGTPRSSMDIYSHSNHSSETLQSEYISPTSVVRPPMHRRQLSHLGQLGREETETLMMGYVQLVGSFILDGSLVNLAPFEIVKRKAVIGGQGSGGVVGIETGKRNSGLFSSLGWSSIGQSIGGFLGSEEPSSIREMKGIASSKSVPIISTAQSILFVDLQLKPGESKRFSYSHPMPAGIPPTFKGRAMKSSYHIVVGTQRPQSGKSQHSVRQVEIPFNVQPSINEEGEVVGHDLMNPHVILKDISKTKALGAADGSTQRRPPSSHSASGQNDNEFEAYVEHLLHGDRKDSSTGLLSPTAAIQAPDFSVNTRASHPTQSSTKEMIEMAIAQQSASGQSRSGSTNLQISRGGERVAKVMLSRSSFRVGETVVGSVDFSGADISCFAFNASLESAEVVDPSIALRSASSIHRATRRIHAQSSENTLWAERVSFALTIPPSVTPEFVTSGVRHEWKLRLEFVTADTQPGERARSLLNIDEEDEKGTYMSASQELQAQSFEVPVTLRVYGTTADMAEVAPTKGFRI